MPVLLKLEDCQQVINKVTNQTGKAIDFSISKISETPMGYLGDHFKLIITYMVESVQKTKSFFLKTRPSGNVDHIQYVAAINKKESLIYKNLLSKFSSYYKEKTLPDCYLVNFGEFMILEDLSADGYNVSNDLELNQWNALIATMARFHAASIIYEKENSIRINEKFICEMEESTFSQILNHPRNKWVKTTSKAVADTMRRLKYDKEADKVLNFVTEDIYTYLKPSLKYQNVVTHADLWRNNVMFKSDGTTIECVLIDFQLARYSPPALDLLITLYLNASSEFLKVNLNNLLDLYYVTFCESLIQHDIQPEKVLTKVELLESLEVYKVPSLIIATMFATIIFISPKITHLISVDEDVANEFTYNNRSKYVMKEIEENLYFKENYFNVLQPLINALEVM